MHSGAAHVVSEMNTIIADRMCAGALTRAVRTAAGAHLTVIASDGVVLLSAAAASTLFQVLTGARDPARRHALAALVTHRRVSGGCAFTLDEGWAFVRLLNAAAR